MKRREEGSLSSTPRNIIQREAIDFYSGDQDDRFMASLPSMSFTLADCLQAIIFLSELHLLFPLRMLLIAVTFIERIHCELLLPHCCTCQPYICIPRRSLSQAAVESNLLQKHHQLHANSQCSLSFNLMIQEMLLWSSRIPSKWFN